MLLRAGTTLNERYEILSTVGTGGMADVYRARDTVLKRLVAIKVLKEEYSSDASFVAKFRREAQAVSALNHPNIVGVFDVGEQNGMYYIVMELVEGINLKKYIEKIGAMDEREAVEVAMQVAKGLEAAHDKGIVHRDIKPQNIIISREGKIKVADFGIARMVATETSTTSTMGSVHYISPEQARGDACDARSDIYSLGITLYEIVTGQVPFDGDSSVSVALKHMQEAVKPDGWCLFSDDANWTREQIIPLLPESDITLVDWNNGEQSVNDMHLMSLCRHHIIANSSFSWWGAWLSERQEKCVIAPDFWMTGRNVCSPAAEGWIKI